MELDLSKSDYKNYPELFNWEDIKRIISTGNLSLLRRHPLHQHAYDDWRTKIITLYGSIPSFILTQRLGWVGQLPQQEAYFTRNTTHNHKLLRNDWGYAIPHNDIEYVEHWVCWSRLPLIHKDLFKDESNHTQALCNGFYGFTGGNNNQYPAQDGAQEIHSWIQSTFPNCRETAYFLNPPHLQSVKEVDHFHIFVRN